MTKMPGTAPAAPVRAGAPADGGHEVRARLLATQPGRPRRRLLAGHVADIVADILGLPPAAIDPTAPLTATGLTSAGILELRARLESTLGIAIAPAAGWRYPTVEALVPHLAELMEIELDPPGRPGRPGRPGA